MFRPRAVDPDQDEKLSFDLLASDSTSWLKVDGGTGVVSVGRTPIPVPGGAEVVVTVGVTDKGGLTASRDYRVRVSTENAHSPTFDFPHREISVAEDTPPGSVIIQASYAAISQVFSV